MGRMLIGRALCEPPDDEPMTLAELRANLAPEVELNELWDILAREGLEDRIETILLQRLEEAGQ